MVEQKEVSDLLRDQQHRRFQMLCAGQMPEERTLSQEASVGFVLCMMKRK